MKVALLLILGVLVVNATPNPAYANPAPQASKLFGFQGARDVIRSFMPTQSPIRLDTCVQELLESMDSTLLERLADLAADSGIAWLRYVVTSLERPKQFAHAKSLQSSCKDRYAKAFLQARLERSILTQAKATIFQEMRLDPTKRNDSAMYLLLAMLHFRLEGFYDIQALRVYIQAYVQKGGEIAKIPIPLRWLIESIPESTRSASIAPSLASISLESMLHALISQNRAGQDSGFFSHGVFTIVADSSRDSTESKESLFARVLEFNQKQCVVLVHFGKRFNSIQPGLNAACFPSTIDEVVLFPFDGRLYVLADDMLYLISPSQDTYSLRAYAHLVFSREQGERFCEIEVIDPKRQEHAAMDLTRAGFMLDSLESALKAWSEEIAGADVNMQVEYLGHLDVFNEGIAVPLARAYTTMSDKRERFYEAFTLTPATLQADISLSHPTMFLQGRLPSLRFVRVGDEILGCVRTPISSARTTLVEEKLFRFHKNALPELVRHQRLRSVLTSIESLDSGMPDSHESFGLESSQNSRGAKISPIASIVKSKLDSQGDSHVASYDYAKMFVRAFGEDLGLVYLGDEILSAIDTKGAYAAIAACLSGVKQAGQAARSHIISQARSSQIFSQPQIQCALESISSQIEYRLQREK